jgi:hypothetical protein
MTIQPAKRRRGWGVPVGLFLSAAVAMTMLYLWRESNQEAATAPASCPIETFSISFASANEPQAIEQPFEAWKAEAKQAARKLLVSAVDKTLGVHTEHNSHGVDEPSHALAGHPAEPASRALPARGESSRPKTPRGDAIAAWEKLGAVAPEDPDTPRWVIDAAGSELWSQDVLGVNVRGSRPGPGGEIVGYSSAYESDIERSRASARRSALDGLKSIALWKITGNKKEAGLLSAGGYFLSVDGISGFLDGLFQRDFHGRARAWYDQKVVIHGEPMFRSAVLVNVDEARMKELVGEAVRSGRMEKYARRYEIIWTTASAAGMAFIIFLLYSLLNAGTKGHFAWPLRIFSVGTLAALYLVLLFLKGWIP